jgi:hypothetical protein
VILTGRTAVHALLQDEANLQDLREEVLTAFENSPQRLWLELEAATAGYYDLDALRHGKDFIADVIAQYDGILEADDLKEWQSVLEPVFGERGGRLPPPDPETLRQWFQRARDLTLDHLVTEED